MAVIRTVTMQSSCMGFKKIFQRHGSTTSFGTCFFIEVAAWSSWIIQITRRSLIIVVSSHTSTESLMFCFKRSSRWKTTADFTCLDLVLARVCVSKWEREWEIKSSKESTPAIQPDRDLIIYYEQSTQNEQQSMSLASTQAQAKERRSTIAIRTFLWAVAESLSQLPLGSRSAITVSVLTSTTLHSRTSSLPIIFTTVHLFDHRWTCQTIFDSDI